MDAPAAEVGPVYRPRNPRQSPLYQCVRNHAQALHEARVFQRGVEERILERFLDCGDLHKGFARIYCDRCGHDYLLAFSCKTHYFCPSCHQKRVLLYGDWVENTILAPVPHRRYVFTLLRLLRPHFKYRPFLGELCRLTARLLAECFHAAVPEGRPAFILFVQTFGDWVTRQPHIHALVSEGVFQENGGFRVLPPIPARLLEEGLRALEKHSGRP